MLAMVHLVTMVTAWHDEPIKLHTCPPTTTHLRAYVIGMGACPSGTQTLTPGRDEVSQLSPSDPHPEGRAPHQFHMDLEDLGDAQLRQLMEDL